MVKDRPILFSTPMVRALLDGRKSQTRRMVKPQPDSSLELKGMIFDWQEKAQAEFETPVGYHTGLMYHPLCPYGKVGDLLWVKETHGTVGFPERAIYRANPADDYQWGAGKPSQGGFRWKPSIFMPRRASRLTLEITDIQVERLQEISEWDARLEGTELPQHHEAYSSPHCISFARLWQEINGYDSWRANPWVWVLSFRVHKKNIDTFIQGGNHGARTA
jgi:hypothetical protein